MKHKGIIITGTDTGVGKTLFAIHHLLQTGGTYWKPIQAGRPRDRETVQNATGFDESHFLPEAYDLTKALSPHEAAKHDEVKISLSNISMPKEISHFPLIVEGAGGILVPINETETMVDLFFHLGFPVLIVARSTLGTINHTLMTLECVRRRKLPILGVVVVGPYMPENEKTIATYGKVKILDRLCPEGA